MPNTVLRMAAAAAVVTSLSVGANAHVIIEGFEGRKNYNEVLNLIVPHGCGEKDTTQIRMKIPGSVPLFAPEEKDGWTTELKMRTLDEPITRPNGQIIREVYDEVVWTGKLPAYHMGVFKFLARITGETGSVVPFKVIQVCGDQQDRWVEVVEDGEPGWQMWALEWPAPFVTVVDGEGPQLGASMREIGAERQRRGSGAGPQ